MIDTRIGSDNRKLIPQLDNKSPYIYVEKARIEQENASICIVQGNEHIPIPVCHISCIMLGPGTTVTHRAIEAISDSGCTLAWIGEDLRAYYATGFEKDRSSKNLLKQIEYYADTDKHLDVVRKMYRLRFADIPMTGLDTLTLEQMRGMEGLRMKEIYEGYAKETGVQWEGRIYTPGHPESQDDVNFLLTVGNQWLYNICRAAIYTLGYTPAVGFIHTGKMDSFTYDMADLYKAEIVIPASFVLAGRYSERRGRSEMSRDIRETCNEKARKIRLFSQIIKDIKYLFDEGKDLFNEDDTSGKLWDTNGGVAQGVNYSAIP